MNKLKFISLAALILTFGSLCAQDDAFYSEVRGFMSESRPEYDKIVSSYFAGQELSADDYTLLYYGYTFTDAYKPDFVNKSVDSLIDAKQYAEAYDALKKEHLKDPSSLQILFDLMGLAFVLEKSDEGQQYQKKYINLLLAIVQASGDGLSRENAIKVNTVRDEFQILSSYFRASSIVKKEFSSSDSIDKVTIKDSEGIVKDVFFDFTRYVAVTSAQ